MVRELIDNIEINLNKNNCTYIYYFPHYLATLFSDVWKERKM